jgi:1,2-diacylglycerol-3-alpha-glucose alpha-1,2-glucosyltransferase
LVSKSGVGEAFRHQNVILDQIGIPYTTDISDDFDMIHLNTIFPDSLIMSRWAKHKGKKVIYYAHSTMEDFRDSFKGFNRIAPIYKLWICHCYNSGDLIITPTDYSKELIESYGIKPSVFSISNGVDVDFFSQNNGGANRFREKYKLKEEDKVIISVGHYIERKGILDFIKIGNDFPDYQFYWFGYTRLNLVPAIIKDAIKNAKPNIHFPGYVNRDELRDAYAGSDLFMFLTKEETEGIALLEALASKIPILIRDIPIYSKWLTDGQNVYKGRNIYEFEEKMVRILEESIPDVTENGYNLVVERDFKSVGKKLMEVYKESIMGTEGIGV